VELDTNIGLLRAVIQLPFLILIYAALRTDNIKVVTILCICITTGQDLKFDRFTEYESKERRGHKVVRRQTGRHNSSTEGIPYNFMPVLVFYYLRVVVAFYTGAK